jgi:hypothetical protein
VKLQVKRIKGDAVREKSGSRDTKSVASLPSAPGSESSGPFFCPTMRAKIKRKWKKWQVGPNRLASGSPVSNRLLTGR